MQMGVTTLVSASLLGGSGNADTIHFAFSANGRYVAFDSYANDLVPRDGNDHGDVFVRDLVNGTTTLVSTNRIGTRSGNGTSYNPTISADGRFIAFGSSATNLVGNDTNGNIGDIFVRDTVARRTTLVSVNRDGNAHGGFNNSASRPLISANGRVVLFTCWDSDMVEGDTNGRIDVFARDLSTGTTYLISAKVARHGFPSNEEAYFINPVVSGDGRYVVFCIDRTDNTSGKNIYVRDLMSDGITLLNTNSGYYGANHPAINGDGRFIAFDSYANDLLPNVSGGNVYVYLNTPPASNEGIDALTR
jgi:Tol biopolymer transport system component